jgi:hypothetical protein
MSEERIEALEQKINQLLAQNERLLKLVVDLNERLTYRERVLVGWKEIAEYLGVFPTTAMQWSKEAVDPLPHDHEHRGNVVARATALDAYKVRRARRMAAARAETATKAANTRSNKAASVDDTDPS